MFCDLNLSSQQRCFSLNKLLMNSTENTQTVHIFPTCFSTSINGLCVLLQGVPKLAMFEEVVPFILEPGQVRRKGPSRGVQVTCVHCRAALLSLSTSRAVFPLSAIGHPLLWSSVSLGLFAASTPASRPAPCCGLIRSASPSSAARGFLLCVPHSCTPSAVCSNSSSLPASPSGRAAATSEPGWGFLLYTPPDEMSGVTSLRGEVPQRCSAAVGQL